MDTDEEPRMSGALPLDESDLNGSSSARNGQLTSESDDERLLGHFTAYGDDDNDEDRSRLASVHEEDEGEEELETSGGDKDDAAEDPTTTDKPLSKNQQKKLKRQQKWEDGRDDRKRRRKEKRLKQQAQKRAAKAEGKDKAEDEGEEDDPKAEAAPPKEHVLVPVSFILDCAFESYMRETEQISLASQITRSYSANRTAARQAHIYISSWGGKLRTRYETLLSNQHKRWNHVYFLEDDFMEAARQAEKGMRGPKGGTIVDVLEGKEKEKPAGNDEPAAENGNKEEPSTTDATEETPSAENPSVVYLTSDSPHTLSRLEPYTSYVIGGIVDKNREKGLCYRRAQEHGIRTAKLPIGDYMVMASRQVLTTNHVVEIMLNWLETGDWAKAFDLVIPKRKGGHLREDIDKAEADSNENAEDRGGESMDLENNQAAANTEANSGKVMTTSTTEAG